MRKSIQILGWSITIITLVLVSFTGLSIYSLVKTLGIDYGLSFGELSYRSLENGFTLTIPIRLNNTGYFEVTDLQFNTTIHDVKGCELTTAASSIPKVRIGSTEKRVHNITITLRDIIDKDLTYLLFNNTEIIMDHFLKFRYAYVYSYQIDVPDNPLEWGAPFHNLTITQTTYNPSRRQLIIHLYFQNESLMIINGTLKVIVFNDEGDRIGLGSVNVRVEPGYIFHEGVRINVEEPSLLSERGSVNLYFEAEGVSFGPVVISYE